MGTLGANVKCLKQESEVKNEQLKKQSSNISSKIVQMLLKCVNIVKDINAKGQIPNFPKFKRIKLKIIVVGEEIIQSIPRRRQGEAPCRNSAVSFQRLSEKAKLCSSSGEAKTLFKPSNTSFRA